MFKVCTHCKEAKSYDLYHKHKKTKDGCDTLCRECRLIKGKVRRQINNAIISEAKYKPCHFCGKISDPVDVDLHHLDPAQKKKPVSQLKTEATAVVVAEIAKCVPVCRPCHVKTHRGD
jgi:hypothetical protein